MEEKKDMTKEKCGHCDKLFLVGEMYDDFGSTFEDGKIDHYFVHVDCHKKAMDEYRHNKWKNETKN